MEPEFPYDRVGEPSNAGRTQANFLRSQPGEYLQKEGEDGVWAYKQGDFLNVENESQVTVDGFYSLGRVGGVQRIVGSPTARGMFTDRGPAVPDTGGGDFTVRQLFFYGKGMGSDYDAELGGFFDDFDGHSNVYYETEVYRTRDGRHMSLYYSKEITGPIGTDLWATAFFIYPGAHYFDGSTLKFQTGWCYRTTGGDGQHKFQFIRDDGEGNVLVETVPPVPNQIAAYALPQRIGPKNFVMMESFVRPRYAVTSIDEAACPGLRFSFSNDNGVTWTPAASTEMYQEFFDTVIDLPTGELWALPFNNATQAAGFTVVPLSANRALVYGVVPYIEVIDIPSVIYNLKGKVKLGIADRSSNTILSTLTLFDGTLNDAGDFWRTSADGQAAGAVVLERPDRVDNQQWNHPLRIMFTPDGVDYVEMGFTPQPSYKCGLLTAVSPTQLFLPMYDGAHSLYESRDRGATWTRRAILSENGPVPAPNTHQVLQDFAVVTFLRNNGRPANGSPGTPWVCDARINAPVL